MTTLAIPRRALIASGSFGEGLDASEVLTAIARGLQAGGSPEPDLCPLASAGERPEDVAELLQASDFDRRMRASRAVIVCAERLHERTLEGSAVFEIATRARQGGVPAYAVTAENALDAFDARILDLQLILEAGTPRSLAAAGRKLAGLL